MIPATASCGTCLAFEFRSVLGAVLYITSHHHPTKFNKIFAKNMRIEFESDVTVIPQVEHELFADGNGFKKDEFAALLKKGISAAQNGERESARNLLMKASEVDPRSEDVWMWLASISEFPEELLAFLNNVLDINPENERAIEWQKGTVSLIAKTLVGRG